MRLFVTGTDTGVGKTIVSCALLAAARAEGFVTRGQKPIETGCEIIAGELVASDAAQLGRAAGHPPDILFRYRLPLAPAAAAREEGRVYPDLKACTDRAADRYAELAKQGRPFQIIEGAGGLLVPLTERELISDLALAIDVPLIVVARDGLGTINHTALTIRSAQDLGLSVLAFVFSATGEVDADRAAANAEAIVEITGAVFGGRLERLEALDRTALSDGARRLPLFQTITLE